MLDRLYVHNYRTFVNFEWRPPRMGVLVGDNGTGKTALLEVIWFLQDLLVNGDELTAGFASTRTAWLDEATQTVEVDLTVVGVSYRYRVELQATTPRTSLAETLTADGELLYRAKDGKVELFGDTVSAAPRTTIPFDRRRSFLAVLEERPDNGRLIAFRRAVEAVQALKPAPWAVRGVSDGESTTLDRTLENFTSWYRSRVQEDFDGAATLHEDLRDTVAGFSSLKLVSVGPTAKEIVTRFRFGETSYDVRWPNLSDGQRALIALYAVLRLALDKASLVILDECETFVGPRELQPWLHKLVEALSDAGVQLLVVSHHPGAIDYLAADAIWQLTRDPKGGHTRAAPLAIDLANGESASRTVAMGLEGG